MYFLGVNVEQPRSGQMRGFISNYMIYSRILLRTFLIPFASRSNPWARQLSRKAKSTEAIFSVFLLKVNLVS